MCALDRLTSGPAGSYTYGDSAHLHAATMTSGSGASYHYGSSGNMTCRAPTSATTCLGNTFTGQLLTYDTEGRLSAWQDAQTSPTTTASYLYDGEGQRVAQKVASSGTTTTTSYVGRLEAATTSGSTTTTTDYYYAAGRLIAETVNGASGGVNSITYLFTNAQGSVIAALNRSGTIAASRLYLPYGAARYSSGAFPTDYGYTGQRADAASGLDYFGARYYDPALGQFTSADTVMDGFNRYAYAGGNPTSFSDPSGHRVEDVVDGGPPGLEEGEVWPDISDYGGGSGSFTNGSLGVGGKILYTAAVVAAIVYLIKGSSISVEDNGDLTVTTPGKGYASTTSRYSPGENEWLYWSKLIAAQNADTDFYNARTAPHTPVTPTAPDTPEAVTETAAALPTQTGGGSAGAGAGGGGGGGVATPVHPDPEDDNCGCGGRVPLYRAIGIRELNDVLKYGDYGIDPSGQGKDFALTEEGARTFAKTGLNVGRNMTITRITVPEEMILSPGEPFFDSGGAGASVQFGFDNGALFDLYDAMSPIEILDAPWIKSIGC